ncbi:MAG: Flp family type IVb pilin [Desulfoplanes sp.]|nr:Flp family type IVb pilin [Desulfoplanes sp.]
MQNAKTLLKRLWNEEDGVTIIEYSLLAALIGVALITVIGTLKDGISTSFTHVAEEVIKK